jgi:hypothetical protein
MIKSVLSILMITLLSGSNIALGQENNLNCPQFITTIGYSEICSVETTAEGFRKSIAAKELSSEELDQIIGEGPASFLINNDNQARILAEVILWDEILKQRSVSMSGSIALESEGSLMHGIQMNGIFK